MKDDPEGTIILVAKCPIPGSVKTRLRPLFGSDEDCAQFALAMLSDVLEKVGKTVSGAVTKFTNSKDSSS